MIICFIVEFIFAITSINSNYTQHRRNYTHKSQLNIVEDTKVYKILDFLLFEKSTYAFPQFCLDFRGGYLFVTA